jgi:hypothetical protein
MFKIFCVFLGLWLIKSGSWLVVALVDFEVMVRYFELNLILDV